MNKKNIAIIGIIIIILSSGLYYYLNKNNNITKNINTEFKINNFGLKVYKKNSIEIKKYNNIIRSSYKKEDLKKCDVLKDKSLKNHCISKIESKIKFPASIIFNGKCDKYTNIKDKDICLYNYYKKTIKDNSYNKKCLNISTKSIQNLCIDKIKSKLSK